MASEESSLFESFPSNSRLVVRKGYVDDDSLRLHSLNTPVFLSGNQPRFSDDSHILDQNEGSKTPLLSQSSGFKPLSYMRVSKIYTGTKPQNSENKASLLPSEMQVSTDHIEDMDFAEYTAKHFAGKRLYGLVKPVEMAWSSKAISAPLHYKIGVQASINAVSTFKNLLTYCGDKTAKKGSNFYVRAILKQGIKFPKLRDEILCQIIKQATNNPSSKSENKCWAMICLCCGTFRPSTDFEPYFLSWLKRNVLDKTKSFVIQNYARYGLLRLSKTHGIERSNPPSDEEINAVLAREPVQVSVRLVNQAPLIAECESWTTAKTLVKQICRMLHLVDGPGYGLYDLNEVEGERLILSEESPLDVLAEWETLRKQERGSDFRLVFKLVRVPSKPTKSVPDEQLEYLQAVDDVLNSRYPLTTKDHIDLAGMILQEIHGDAKKHVDVIGNSLADYLPVESFDVSNNDTIKEQVRRAHALCQGMSKSGVRRKYVEYVRSRVTLYGSSYYAVRFKAQDKKTVQMFLALNGRGIHLIDWNMIGVEETISLDVIQKCECTDKRFYVFVYQGVKEFITGQGKEMQAVFDAYTQDNL